MKYGEVWKDDLDQETVMILAFEGNSEYFVVLILVQQARADPAAPSGTVTRRDFTHRDLIPNWERVDDPA